MEVANNHIVLLGKAGSGKGTQSEKLKQKYKNLVHISTGDLIRHTLKNPNQKIISKDLKSEMQKGKLLPDEKLIEILKEEIANHDKNTKFIFDGFPRTSFQAKKLFEEIIPNQDTTFISYEVSDEECRNRIFCRIKSTIIENGKEYGVKKNINDEEIRQLIKEYKNGKENIIKKLVSLKILRKDDLDMNSIQERFNQYNKNTREIKETIKNFPNTVYLLEIIAETKTADEIFDESTLGFKNALTVGKFQITSRKETTFSKGHLKSPKNKNIKTLY